MKKVLAALTMSLLFTTLAMAETPQETGQNIIPAFRSAWQMCLEQLPNFGRLSTVDDKELGLLLTLPERIEQIRAMAEPAIKKLERNLLKPLSADEYERTRVLGRVRILFENCLLWHDLGQVLEAQEVDREKLIQQAKVLRHKLEQSDPTIPFHQQEQVTAAEKQIVDSIGRELPLVAGFFHWLRGW